MLDTLGCSSGSWTKPRASEAPTEPHLFSRPPVSALSSSAPPQTQISPSTLPPRQSLVSHARSQVSLQIISDARPSARTPHHALTTTPTPIPSMAP